MKRNRWLTALAAVGIHMSIGSVYAWSVLTRPIMKEMGFSLAETTWTFSLAILFLGFSAGFLGSFVFCLPCCGLYAVYLGLVGLYLCICRLDLFTYFRSVAVQYYPSGVFAVKVFAQLLLQLFNVVLAAAYQSVELAHLQHVSGPAGYVAGDAA